MPGCVPDVLGPWSVPVPIQEKVGWLERYIEQLERFGIAKDARDEPATDKAIDELNRINEAAAAEWLWGLRMALRVNPMRLHELIDEMYGLPERRALGAPKRD